jgi:hypothetical protein
MAVAILVQLDFRFQVFRGGLIERQNLNIDSTSVHRRQAFCSNIQ